MIQYTLSDEHIKSVRECRKAIEMWQAVSDLFQRRTFLNRLSARRKFYTARVEENERII